MHAYYLLLLKQNQFTFCFHICEKKSVGHLWIWVFRRSMVNPDLVSPLLPRATTTQEFADSDTNMIDSLLLLLLCRCFARLKTDQVIFVVQHRILADTVKNYAFRANSYMHRRCLFFTLHRNSGNVNSFLLDLSKSKKQLPCIINFCTNFASLERILRQIKFY